MCGADLIPGIGSCVNCGEPIQSITLQVFGLRERDDFDPAAAIAQNNLAREFSRSMTEGECLERAGDPAGAIEVYERLLAEGIRFTPPYRRLAILYGKAKRIDDEERVVRRALAVVGGGPRDWFVVRLAKILERRRKGKP